MNPVHYSSNRHDWGTPQPLFDLLHERHGFDIDVAANRWNRKLPKWLGPDHSEPEFRDAFHVSWAGHRCWLNPEYGDRLPTWMAYASTEVQHGCPLIVMLVPARTDTAWWQGIVMKSSCRVEFIRGRLTFEQHRSAWACKNCAHNGARKRGRASCVEFVRELGWQRGCCPDWKACTAPFPSAVVTFSAEMGGPPRFDSLEVPR